MSFSYQNIRKTVFLGAFLHDIGKAIQRGDTEVHGNHSKVGGLFLLAGENKEKIKKITGENFELLEDIISHHHEGKFTPYEQRIEKLKNHRSFCRLVSRADNFSSGERGESSSTTKNWEARKKTPLASVFQDVVLSAEKTKNYQHFPFSILSLEKKNFFATENVQTRSNIEALIASFEKSFNELINKSNDDFESFFNTLYLLAYHYFWCIPANTKEENPTVSLFDHLKTTAAIALCSFDFHLENKTLENDNFIKDKGDNVAQFQLLCVDFSGIQNYIFSMEKAMFMAKRLRARSFFVEILLEEVKQMILEKFELYPTNILFQAGGKFFVLLPNLRSTGEKIKEIQKTVDTAAFEKFNAEISLNIGISEPFSGKEMMENFSGILLKISEKLNESKYHPFRSVLKENGFIINSKFETNGICPLCRKFPISTKKDDQDCCEWCLQDINIGTKLKDEKNNFLNFYADNTEGDFQLFRKSFSISEKLGKKAKEVIVYNTYNDEILRKIDTGVFSKKFDIRSFANHIPVGEDDEPLDFQEIAQKSEGKKMLGVLKGDVDNLGQIFAVGLERDGGKSLNSPSRQATLSRNLDLFFAGYLNEFVREHFNNCYIIYAGGDDFLIIGPWTNILDLAKSFQKEFTQYVKNPEITFSAGIAFFKPKFPIAKAIFQAEAALKKAKESDENTKNKLCVFDNVIKWENLENLWQEKERLCKWGKNGTISIGFIRSLLDYGRMMENFKKKNDPQFLRWQPMLAYQIIRNLKKKSDEEKWATEILERDSILADGNCLSFVASFALYLLRE